jgi:hypothetical protein
LFVRFSVLFSFIALLLTLPLPLPLSPPSHPSPPPSPPLSDLCQALTAHQSSLCTPQSCLSQLVHLGSFLSLFLVFVIPYQKSLYS